MFTTRPEIRGTFGMASTTHWIASSTAMAILEKGGNAFDAAVAAGFVFQVVTPHLYGPCSESAILLWSSARRKVEVICAQGVAPKGASPGHYRSLGLSMMPATGSLSACVPGSFDGWMIMLRDYGTLRLAEVLEPAIYYAATGYPVVARLHTAIETVRELFSSEWRASAQVYLRNGATPPVNELLSNPQLARTYRRLVAAAESAGSDRVAQIESARAAWSRGFVAEAIDAFCRTRAVLDTTGGRNYGVLRHADMAGWSATVEEPVTYDYLGYTVAKCGPWTQGPVLLQSLALLRHFDVASMDPFGAPFVHTVAECAKLAFADREAWYGDPKFVPVPMRELLADDYAAKRAQLVTGRALNELLAGAVGARLPRMPTFPKVSPEETARAKRMGVSDLTGARFISEESPRGGVRGDTCHMDIIDRWGNMVAATPSGGFLQSNPVIEELGFCLNSRLQMCSLEEGVHNSLQPGKRPRTTLSPTLVLKDGEPYLMCGTSGGDQQDQWALIFLLRHIHHGMNLQEALDAASFHSEHMPSSFWPRTFTPGVLSIENRFPAQVIEELRARGHQARAGKEWTEGRLVAAAREPREGNALLKAAASPRGMECYAAGR